MRLPTTRSLILLGMLKISLWSSTSEIKLPVSKRQFMMPSIRCVNLIKEREGVRYKAYQDTSGIWTIGVGHTKNVKKGDMASPNQINEWLFEDLHEAAGKVSKSVKVPLTQGMFDALCSFVFNIGYVGSTMLRKLNQGDYKGAAQQFDRWIYDEGKVLDGLVA